MRWMATVFLVLVPVASIAAPTCSPPPDPGSGRQPVWDSCCAFADYTCPQDPNTMEPLPAPGLAPAAGSDPADPRTRFRKNVLLVVADDVGFCMAGFQGGRCMAFDDTASESPRCTGRVCTNAPWIHCASVAECPPAEGSAPEPACRVPAAEVPCACRGGGCVPCDGVCECAGGYCVPADDECRSGYCKQCDDHEQCDRPREVCVDGICSPRADCSTAGDFVCARGRGECTPVGFLAFCENPAAKPCNGHADCIAGQGPVPHEWCIGGQCRTLCGTDDDCNDTCEQDTCVSNACAISGKACTTDDECASCRNTAAPCRHNSGADSECNREAGYVCGRGGDAGGPLRTNEIGCRYREAFKKSNKNNWKYDVDTAPSITQTVYTPNIDQLANQSLVFTRGRTGGQNCVPGRAAMLLGREMRHRNFLVNSQGQCSAPLDWTHDEPETCTFDPGPPGAPDPESPGCDSLDCDLWHTLSFWMKGGDLEQDGPEDSFVSRTYSIAVGKVQRGEPEAATWDEEIQTGGNFPPIAKFTCDLDSDCESAIRRGDIPREAFDSIAEATEAIQALIGADGHDAQPAGEGNKHLPFMMWYAPELPHTATGVANLFKQNPDGIYETQHPIIEAMTFFDAGFGALVDELKNTCVCGEGGAKESVWDNTVTIVIPDHGRMLQRSKNAHPPTENSRRALVLVHDPKLGSHFFDPGTHQIGHFDLLPTILDYTNGYDDGAEPELGTADRINRYPLARNLRALLENASTDEGTSDRLPAIRNVSYGADSSAFDGVGDAEERYAVARAGFIGICDQPGQAVLCHDGTTDCPGGGACLRADDGDPSDPHGRVCLDGSYAPCTADADCGGDCDEVEKKCVLSATHPFHDFAAGTSCVDDRDCVPEGICGPPLLKVIMSQANPPNTKAYELHADPDENTDIEGSSLLPASLQAKFEVCIEEFFALTNDAWAAPPTTSSCQQEFRTWQACDVKGCPECCVGGTEDGSPCVDAGAATACVTGGGACEPCPTS